MNLSERHYPPVSRTDLVRYAGASGDFHPLHHDEEFCRAAGFPSPFAMGMYSAGLIGGWLAEAVGPERVRRLRIRFERQVWPGDELVVSGHPTGENVIEMVCRRVDGTAVTRGWATVERARSDAAGADRGGTDG